MSSSVLSGRRALITGATDGIGRHTAAGLADRGAHVTIVGRDQVRGRTAAVDITRETGNPEVEFVSADLSTRSGVRALAERIDTGPLDILINNIGGLYMTRWETRTAWRRRWR
jgi:NAD(P)-dependent dehydrogenase (short-subunit alcohol dehydrogenase family)